MAVLALILVLFLLSLVAAMVAMAEANDLRKDIDLILDTIRIDDAGNAHFKGDVMAHGNMVLNGDGFVIKKN